MDSNKEKAECALKDGGNYDTYNQKINYCRDARDKNIQSLDKNIMIISTALFGIIISSLDKILPLFNTLFLKSCFAVSVILTAAIILAFLMSTIFANKGFKSFIDKEAEEIYLHKKPYNGPSCYTKIAEVFGTIYLICFGAEIIVFTVLIISIVYI